VRLFEWCGGCLRGAQEKILVMPPGNAVPALDALVHVFRYPLKSTIYRWLTGCRPLSAAVLLAGALLAAGLAGAGCQTLREVAQLRDVRFEIDRVSDARLAQVRLERLQSVSDLTTADLLRLGGAVADGRLPLDFVLHLQAENPPDNSVQARIVRMDWTLMIDDEETVSGVFDREVVLPPGEPKDVPIPVELNLVEFFQRDTRQLVDLALAVTGQSGEPKNLKVVARPKVDTPIGRITYPEPITIVNRDVGRTAGEASGGE
jgi:hypothetical protein